MNKTLDYYCSNTVFVIKLMMNRSLCRSTQPDSDHTESRVKGYGHSQHLHMLPGDGMSVTRTWKFEKGNVTCSRYREPYS